MVETQTWSVARADAHRRVARACGDAHVLRVIAPAWPFKQDRELPSTSVKCGAEVHSGTARQSRFSKLLWSLNLTKFKLGR
eukprot:4858386-Pleurochrysis_carterae.AAC.1